MSDSFFKKVEKTVKHHKKKSIWTRVVMSIAMVVVFVTTYMLILPAITMEKKTICGKEEHQHTEACYKEVTTKLLCEEQLPDIHQHTKECYDNHGNLICGYADFILHTHTKECYNEDGDLICPLQENTGHKHNKECYDTDGTLVCGEAESCKTHTHTKECYKNEDGTTSKFPVCGKLEVYEHVHNKKCFPEPEKELICGKEEHIHTKDCYADDEENDVNKSTEDNVTEENKQESTTATTEESESATTSTVKESKTTESDTSTDDTESTKKTTTESSGNQRDDTKSSTKEESTTAQTAREERTTEKSSTSESKTESSVTEATTESTNKTINVKDELGDESEEAMAILENTSTTASTKRSLKRKASRNAESGISTQEASGEIDFKNNITSIEVKYKDDEGSTGWKDPSIVNGRYQLSEKNVLRMEIHYTLPKGTLSDASNTIVYQIPEGITVRSNSQGVV